MKELKQTSLVVFIIVAILAVLPFASFAEEIYEGVSSGRGTNLKRFAERQTVDSSA